MGDWGGGGASAKITSARVWASGGGARPSKGASTTEGAEIGCCGGEMGRETGGEPTAGEERARSGGRLDGVSPGKGEPRPGAAAAVGDADRRHSVSIRARARGGEWPRGGRGVRPSSSPLRCRKARQLHLNLRHGNQRQRGARTAFPPPARPVFARLRVWGRRVTLQKRRCRN